MAVLVLKTPGPTVLVVGLVVLVLGPTITVLALAMLTLASTVPEELPTESVLVPASLMPVLITVEFA